ncbi:DUF4926 domain-containing protein [Glycomyces harbinensis]|uniref:Uncharacterized protein n=1 Tax=Glycomyces harbinensis TaxID=58114 RepID=A0A1G7D4G9_9ACTN|nr:DUF4926 domain-containing protein [Glycomyces harbinensis]SDE46564.1 protein of unknown function [Glycomyces harbinensis]
MNRSTDPHLPRMPGSAILAVVFLCLLALMCLTSGFNLRALSPAFGGLLLAAAGFNASIAVGVARRRRWARATGIAGCVVVLALALFEAMRTTAEGGDATVYSGLIGLNGFLLFFLAHRNTRAWCDRGREPRPQILPLARPEAAPEPFTFNDSVELLEPVEESGLRAGLVGTVVDTPSDTSDVIVEFTGLEGDQTAQVALRPDQIRLLDTTES